ncbi:LLM class flavin-dependent oxidoreductase [Nocardia terpenica]|uniref:LLM class flavin-dependent oxidoreductase n=1 Tax=Nocardia terpenica TaxID=455432 RepID=UPI002B4AEB7D|nr:LLM class flavin-dependent oxidoreductase [Nocardia terpenica]
MSVLAKERACSWTEPFDFHGAYVRLTEAFGSPKPVQRPHPPIMIGGCSSATLRIAAEHADIWNIPGGDIDDATRAAIGEAIDAGFRHIILGLFRPIPPGSPGGSPTS